jgi:hypothetical protein
LAAESSSGQLVEKEVESGDAAVAGDEEISSGIRRRHAGAARYPFDAAAIAQFLGLGNGLILKVGVSRLDRAGDAVDFVAASGSVRYRLVPSRSVWPCRDRATTTCNLLGFNGTDSPFLILYGVL